MPRGRPRKNPITTPTLEVGAKRPRGRPPKHEGHTGNAKAAPSSPVAETAAAPQTSTRNDLRAAIKQARRILRKDDGISTDIERLPLLTWLMFLKFLDESENQAEQVASLTGRAYAPLISAPYRWRDWAAGTRRLSGGDLLSFVNAEVTRLPDGKQGPGLLNYLRSLPHGPNEDRRAIIRNVFENRTCHLQDGANLAEVCACIDGIHFTSREEVHTLSLLYEDMLREMRDAAGQNGEFYTPRPVIRLCIEALDPRLGETFIDNACGTGGFVVAAWEYLKTQAHSAKDLAVLGSTVRGAEPKPLPYLLVQMNTLLHGMDGVRIDRLNAFVKRLADYGSDDEVDIIGTNVPFGAEVTKAQINAFPPDRQTGDSALLFLQVIMARLRRTPTSAKRPARAAVIVPNGVLSEEGVANHIKRDLLTQFRLHTIIRLPDGVFAPYTDIPTNILLFEVANPAEGQTATEDIWYYQIPVSGDRNKFSKTQPVTWDDLAPALAWCQNPVDVEHAWKVPWGERHRTADAAAAPHRQRAQDTSEAARTCSRELRTLKGDRPEAKAEIAALEQRLAATEAEAKAAQAQADALYWPVFDLDNKNPRSVLQTSDVAPGDLAIHIRSQTVAIAALIDEANGLIHKAFRDFSVGDNLKRSPEWREVSLSEVLQPESDWHAVIAGESYPNAGILNFGRGMFAKGPISGSDSSANQLNKIKAGQFIYSRLFAFEGAYTIVPQELDGRFVSNEFPTFRCDLDRIEPSFLAAIFRSPKTWSALAKEAAGLGLRRQRIQPEAVLAHRIWLPPLEYQRLLQLAWDKMTDVLSKCENVREDTKSLRESALLQVFG